MLRQQKDVLLIRQPDQPAADQRLARQIERRARLFLAQIQKRGLRFRPVPQIMLDYRQSPVPGQNLDLRVILSGDERAAQRLVTGKQAVKAAPPGDTVEPALQSPPQGNVIVRAVFVQLCQEPETLLRIGQRKRTITSDFGMSDLGTVCAPEPFSTLARDRA